MIYLSGDTHGTFDLQKVEDFFEIEKLIRDVSKQDYLIILGDTGICWDGGAKDEWVRERLQKLPVTVLWLDGNHENFDLLSEYPVTSWHGGKVHRITPNIIHLMRGCCYKIEGKTFWTFGGGFSIDKRYRTESVSWWQQEMPDKEEYDRGLNSLKKCNFQVDCILTHTAPRHVVEAICDAIYPGEEELQYYLQDISRKTKFKEWYFGHWHMDVAIWDKYHGLMEDVVRLEF